MKIVYALLEVLCFFHPSRSRSDTDNVNISKVLIWLSYAFDNDATPFFALIICLWGK